jgi:hypothetical protein
MPNQPPYEEDFFQRIVNVNWKTGVVFVYGTESGNQLHYVKISGPDSKPTTHAIALPEPATIMGKIGFGVVGGSYAKIGGKAVFLVCGTVFDAHEILDEVGNPTGAINYTAVIFSSHDGLVWGKVREQTTVNDSVILSELKSVYTVALVWDGSNFHYDQFYQEAAETHEQIFSSSDGAGWSGGSGGFFPSFCTGNDCRDANGQNVPDGVMRYDTKTQIDVQPVNPPAIFYDTGRIEYRTYGTSTVKVTTHPPAGQIAAGFSSTVSVPGIALVTCVAGCNGIFMAGGFVSSDGDGPGAVALSTDGGKTWTHFAGTSSGVTTMIAAPASDIKSS